MMAMIMAINSTTPPTVPMGCRFANLVRKRRVFAASNRESIRRPAKVL